MAAGLQGIVQPIARQCTKPAFMCHCFARWGYELSPNGFSSWKPFSSLFHEHLYALFPPGTKLPHSLESCSDRSQNAQVLPSLRKSLCCWQNRHLMLQGAVKEKFAFSRRVSVCASLKGICDFNKSGINHSAGCWTKILKLLLTISGKAKKQVFCYYIRRHKLLNHLCHWMRLTLVTKTYQILLISAAPWRYSIPKLTPISCSRKTNSKKFFI